MDQWGPDEEAIFAALTGRTKDERDAITAAYTRVTNGRSLETDLRDELSGSELTEALRLLNQGEDELHLAMAGIGTDEDRVNRVLESMRNDPNAMTAMEQRYRSKYGDLVDDVRSDFSDDEYARRADVGAARRGGRESRHRAGDTPGGQVTAELRRPGVSLAELRGGGRSSTRTRTTGRRLPPSGTAIVRCAKVRVARTAARRDGRRRRAASPCVGRPPGRDDQAARRAAAVDRRRHESVAAKIHVFGHASAEPESDATPATALLSKLPGEQREAVRAPVLGERGYDELATAFRTSEAAIRQRVSRGLRCLRSRLRVYRAAQELAHDRAFRFAGGRDQPLLGLSHREPLDCSASASLVLVRGGAFADDRAWTSGRLASDWGRPGEGTTRHRLGQ